jgi:hypothetical protein
VGHAGLDGGEGVGHRAPGVVLAVDPEPAGHPAPHLGHDPRHAAGQHAAIGVAEHTDLGAGGERRLQHPDAVVTVGGVAVEEVLAVQEHPPAVRDEEGNGVGHHREVLLQRRP